MSSFQYNLYIYAFPQTCDKTANYNISKVVDIRSPLEKNLSETPFAKFQKHRNLAKFQTKVRLCEQNLYQGSSFSETTLDCLFRFATLTKTTERHDGAHQGRRIFCSPFKQATEIVPYIRKEATNNTPKKSSLNLANKINRDARKESKLPPPTISSKATKICWQLM